MIARAYASVDLPLDLPTLSMLNKVSVWMFSPSLLIAGSSFTAYLHQLFFWYECVCKLSKTSVDSIRNCSEKQHKHTTEVSEMSPVCLNSWIEENEEKHHTSVFSNESINHLSGLYDFLLCLRG